MESVALIENGIRRIEGVPSELVLDTSPRSSGNSKRCPAHSLASLSRFMRDRRNVFEALS
jgi:hypothetical protein